MLVLTNFMFDPDEGHSVEQMVRRLWAEEWSQDFKTRLLAEAEAAAPGCSWFEYAVWRIKAERELLQDPAAWARYLANEERRLCPYGHDPLLRKAGDP